MSSPPQSKAEAMLQDEMSWPPGRYRGIYLDLLNLSCHGGAQAAGAAMIRGSIRSACAQRRCAALDNDKPPGMSADVNSSVMSNQYLMYEQQGAVARITLRENAGLVAPVGGIWGALQRAFLAVDASAVVRAVLISGASGAFAFDATREGGISTDTARRADIAMTLSMLRNSPVPVAVALQGKVVAGGVLLGLSCDWIIAGDEVEFIALDQVLHLAGSPGSGAMLVPALGAAGDLAVPGRGVVVGGRAAEEMGLVTECVARAALQQRADAVARRLAQGPTRALAMTRQLLDAPASVDFETQCRRELEVNQVLRASHDSKEGVQAFLEKRRARFRGE